MSCEVSEARRRKLPLKISRLFEHGQNKTLDNPSLSLPLLVLASFKTNIFLCQSIIFTGYVLSFRFITRAEFSLSV
jgi:hypothetical protein